MCEGSKVWLNKNRQDKRGACMPDCVCSHGFKRLPVFVISNCEDSGEHLP